MSHKLSIPPKDELESYYQTVKSISKTARHFGTSNPTVRKWLQHYSTIKKYTHAEAVNHDFTLKKVELKKVKTFDKSSVGQLNEVSQNEVSQVSSFIESLGFTVITNDRKLIAPLELDIIIPEKNIAIEYCGIYYHSETWGNKDRNYHLKKYDLCKEAGFKLITIFENEWFNRKDIIKSILARKLDKNKYSIGARKTTFHPISYKDIKQFEIDNHRQGTRSANKYYGLFYEGRLVMSMSIGKSRFNKQVKNEIVRMTTKKDTNVVGGMSKLVRNIGLTDCITYADKRYGDGLVYEKVGFTRMKDSSPNYFYFHKTDHNTTYSRNKFQKHKIPNVDASKSEYGNMLAQGYDRIWDCGNAVYYYHK
jgi:transposase-like protein